MIKLFLKRRDPGKWEKGGLLSREKNVTYQLLIRPQSLTQRTSVGPYTNEWWKNSSLPPVPFIPPREKPWNPLELLTLFCARQLISLMIRVLQTSCGKLRGTGAFIFYRRRYANSKLKPKGLVQNPRMYFG